MNEAEALKRAIGLLARREHGAQELKTKLLSKGAAASDLDPLIEYLQSKNYQSDQRFVESYIRAQFNRGRGISWIKYELSKIKINSVLIEKVLLNLELDWDALAQQVALKKFPSEVIGPADQAKLQRFMMQRGFTHSQIKFASNRSLVN